MPIAYVIAGLFAASVSAMLWLLFGQRKLDRRVEEMLGEMDGGAVPSAQSGFEAFKASSLVNGAKRFFLPSRATLGSLQLAGFRGANTVLWYTGYRVLAASVFGGIAWAYLAAQTMYDVSGVILPALCLVAAVIGWQLPRVMVQNRIVKRQQGIQRAWPNALDLLLVCVESGVSLEQALKRVADEIGAESIDLAEELTVTIAELSYLPDRRMAYDNIVARTGLDSIRGVASAFKQSERHGTSLAGALRVLAQESRDLRLAAAEKKAAALPPKLTVPMILFFLPVLFAAILSPAIIQIMSR